MKCLHNVDFSGAPNKVVFLKCFRTLGFFRVLLKLCMLVSWLPKKPFHLFGYSAMNLSLLKLIRVFSFLKTSGLIGFQTTLIADLFAAQHDICINLKTTGNTFPTSGKFEETILFLEIDF